MMGLSSFEEQKLRVKHKKKKKKPKKPAFIDRNISANDISSSINTSQEFSPYGLVIDVLQNGLPPISREKSYTIFKKHEYGNLEDLKVPDEL